MSTERDPRTDPRPGDVLEWQDNQGWTWTAEVEQARLGHVLIRETRRRDVSPPHWEVMLLANRACVIVRGDSKEADHAR